MSTVGTPSLTNTDTQSTESYTAGRPSGAARLLKKSLTTTHNTNYMKARYLLPLAALLLSAALTACDDEGDGLPAPAVGGFDDYGATVDYFTVGSSTRVHFSRGNLQYNPSTDKWRLAEQQYDCAGDANAEVSATYDGWIDLFGWGTSGWNSGAVAYLPCDTSTNAADYRPGGSTTASLTGDFAQADWGQNPIANGGALGGMWRTLTADEWHYLLELRTDAPNKRGAATIAATCRGIIIVPDGWVRPAGIAFTPEFTSYDVNSYTAEQWKTIEASGAIFLPAAGSRWGSNVSGVGAEGHYWSSSPYDENGAGNLYFNATSLGAVYGHNRHLGYAVRLVRE